jgi:hypothetical protein
MLICVSGTYSNSLLMLVLGIDNAKSGVLLVSEGAHGDDAALLNCLEHVSYAEFFLECLII